MGRVAYDIAPARTAADMAAVTALFGAYADALGVDLSYQGFAAELSALPAQYAPPDGELLLARLGSGEAVGCVGLRRLAVRGCGEMKRLYVSPAGRGLGIGRALVASVVAVGRAAGYAELRLDTAASMAAAVTLYRAAGFVDIAAYCATPFADAMFLGLRLRDVAGGPSAGAPP